jgi:hypothetical protein
MLATLTREKLFQGTVEMLRENKAPVAETKKAMDDLAHLLLFPSVQKNLDAAELAH